jgi:hypothetical protein
VDLVDPTDSLDTPENDNKENGLNWAVTTIQLGQIGSILERVLKLSYEA